MDCKNCGSDNTQRLEVVYDGGYSTTESTSYSIGLLGGNAGGGLGSARTTTNEVSVSNLAKKAAPPEKLTYRYLIILIAIGALLVTKSSELNFWFFFGLLLIATGGYLVHFAYKFNKYRWPLQYAHWQRQWFCHKCGNIFH